MMMAYVSAFVLRFLRFLPSQQLEDGEVNNQLHKIFMACARKDLKASTKVLDYILSELVLRRVGERCCQWCVFVYSKRTAGQGPAILMCIESDAPKSTYALHML